MSPGSLILDLTGLTIVLLKPRGPLLSQEISVDLSISVGKGGVWGRALVVCFSWVLLLSGYMQMVVSSKSSMWETQLLI